MTYYDIILNHIISYYIISYIMLCCYISYYIILYFSYDIMLFYIILYYIIVDQIRLCNITLQDSTLHYIVISHDIICKYTRIQWTSFCFYFYPLCSRGGLPRCGLRASWRFRPRLDSALRRERDELAMRHDELMHELHTWLRLTWYTWCFILIQVLAGVRRLLYPRMRSVVALTFPETTTWTCWTA